MKLRNIFIAGAIALSLGFTACNDCGTCGSSAKVTNDADSVSYAIGLAWGQGMKQQFPELNPQVLAKGLNDAYTDAEETLFADEQAANAYVQQYMMKQSQVKGQENLKVGEEFLADNGKKSGVTTLESGLQYEVLKEGNGAKPTLEDKVSCHYHGTLIDGTVFDSSVDRGQPASFPVNGVIPGWTEALQLMPVGSKWKLYVPAALAYGERGAGRDIGPNSALIFEVELLEIEK